MAAAAQLIAVMKMPADPTRRAVFERIAGNSEFARAARRQPCDGAPQGAARLLPFRAEGLAPMIDWLSYCQAFWQEDFENPEKPLKEDQ